MTASRDSELEWAARWTRAAVVLEAERARALAALTDDAALAAAQDVLSIDPGGDLAACRRDWSGLVEWQRALRRRR